MKPTKNKYAIYAGIFVSEIIIIFIISRVLGVGTENTWLGMVGATVVFVSLKIVLLIEATKHVKEGRMMLGCLLYLIILMLSAGLIANIVIFYAGI